MTRQLLHLVFGGELKALDRVEFRDLEKLHFVGVYPNFARARAAWKAAAQATVDNAHMRYFVVHLHRLMQPDEAALIASTAGPSKRTVVRRTGKQAKSPRRK